jgi:hypothetical protein
MQRAECPSHSGDPKIPNDIDIDLQGILDSALLLELLLLEVPCELRRSFPYS